MLEIRPKLCIPNTTNYYIPTGVVCHVGAGKAIHIFSFFKHFI